MTETINDNDEGHEHSLHQQQDNVSSDPLSSLSLPAPVPAVAPAPLLHDINNKDCSTREISESTVLIELLRMESLRHVDAAWRAQRRLMQACLRQPSPEYDLNEEESNNHNNRSNDDDDDDDDGS